jgi:hypothetical protein
MLFHMHTYHDEVDEKEVASSLHFLQQSFLSPVLHGQEQLAAQPQPFPHCCEVQLQSE